MAGHAVKCRTMKWFWPPIPAHPLPLPRASGGLSPYPACVSKASPPIAAASVQFRYRTCCFVGSVGCRLPGVVVGSDGGPPSDPTTEAGRRPGDSTRHVSEHFSKNVLSISCVIPWVSGFVIFVRNFLDRPDVDSGVQNVCEQIMQSVQSPCVGDCLGSS